MKLKTRLLLFLLVVIIKLWLKTLRVSIIDPYPADEVAIFAFFHGQQLSLLKLIPKTRPKAMISLSQDGEIQAKLMSFFGISAIRGSSSRGGVRALLEAKKALEQAHSILMAVDGPRGPIEEVKSGCVYLSYQSQKPIYLCHVKNQCQSQLKSWDHFELPLPFSRVLISFERIDPPPRKEKKEGGNDLTMVPSMTSAQHLTAQLEEYRLEIQKRLKAQRNGTKE